MFDLRGLPVELAWEEIVLYGNIRQGISPRSATLI